MKSRYILLAIWIIACVYSFASYLFHDLVWTNSEVYSVYFLKISILTFPLGPLCVTVGELVLNQISFLSDILNMQGKVIATWVVMVVLGYIQWFVLVPKLYKFLSNRFFKAMKK